MKTIKIIVISTVIIFIAYFIFSGLLLTSYYSIKNKFLQLEVNKNIYKNNSNIEEKIFSKGNIMIEQMYGSFEESFKSELKERMCEGQQDIINMNIKYRSYSSNSNGDLVCYFEVLK